MFPGNATRNVAVSAILLLLASGSVSATQDGGSTDETRLFQASQRALEYLVRLAELRTGVTELSFDIDPQKGCRPRYSSSVCPIYGKSRLDALRAAGRRDVEAEVQRLHHAADFDRSGFVSDEEGKRFGMLVYFGQQMDYLVMKQGRYSADRFAQLMRLDPVEFRTRLHDYKKLVGRAKKLGIDFPEARSIN